MNAIANAKKLDAYETIIVVLSEKVETTQDKLQKVSAANDIFSNFIDSYNKDDDAIMKAFVKYAYKEFRRDQITYEEFKETTDWVADLYEEHDSWVGEAREELNV